MRLSWIKSLIYNLRYIPLSFIYFYQKKVSPLIPSSCRFYPSCSEYARLAIKKYGIIRGGWMSLIRILKCHPFHPGGYNPLD